VGTTLQEGGEITIVNIKSDDVQGFCRILGGTVFGAGAIVKLMKRGIPW